MRLLIITHVEHQVNGNNISAYGPYIREMNLWLKYADQVTLVAPKSDKKKGLIDLCYNHDHLNFKIINAIQFTSVKKSLISVFKIPLILYSIFNSCKKADHIHLRCPGNIGLLGCLVQILFPKKIKTAKYAGNWDPDAVQPRSYRFQKWILSNTFLTKNMTTLVYGEWKNQTKNIKSFFTATYANEEREVLKDRNYSGVLKFAFVGSLVAGKCPLFVIKIVEELNKLNYDITLDLYGEGVLKADLLDYTLKNNLEPKIRFLGNKEKDVIKKSLKETHFLILPSKSEGWPKVIAEAMFFGVIPISTRVSCIPNMLGYGARGILINYKLKEAVEEVKSHLKEDHKLKEMSNLALKWSQKYTLNIFEEEIAKLIEGK